MVLFIKRKPVPAADPLVAGAVKAQPVLSDFEKSLAAWKLLPSPDARRPPCRFCGDNLIQRCKGDEHVRCWNFHRAQKKVAWTADGVSAL